MSSTTELLFDLIIWCQAAALLLNTILFIVLLRGRKMMKEGEPIWKRHRS